MCLSIDDVTTEDKEFDPPVTNIRRNIVKHTEFIKYYVKFYNKTPQFLKVSMFLESLVDQVVGAKFVLLFIDFSPFSSMLTTVSLCFLIFPIIIVNIWSFNILDLCCLFKNLCPIYSNLRILDGSELVLLHLLDLSGY